MSKEELDSCNEKILCFVKNTKKRIKKLKENCDKRNCKEKKSA